MQLQVCADAGAVADRAAEWLAFDSRRAIVERGRWVLGMSGGRTPGATFRALAARCDVWWARTVFVQVDERVAPASGPDRNLTDQLEALAPALARGARLVPLAAAEELTDADRLARSSAALERAAGRPPVLDVAQLGLGVDGHMASLVPGDAVLDVDDRDVALTGPYEGRRRLTLTYRTLRRARRRLWIVTGDSKRGSVARLLAADPAIPAGRVNPRSTMVLVDRAASP
ncbi:MAG: 6-phosphogluconolactonase [Acidimicrobiales bacterium]